MPITRSQAAKSAASDADGSRASVDSVETCIRAAAARKSVELERERAEAVSKRVDAEQRALEAQVMAEIAAVRKSAAGSRASSLRSLRQPRTRLWLESQSELQNTNASSISGSEMKNLSEAPVQAQAGASSPPAFPAAAAAPGVEFGAGLPDRSFVLLRSGGQHHSHPHTHNHELGTHLKNNFVNMDKNNLARGVPHDSDFEKLAAAIQGLAAQPAPRRKASDIRLPVFSGDCTEWLTFKKTYERTSPFFDPLENISRLVTSLVGTAKEAVSTLVAATDNPDLVMQELEGLFGRPELIVRQLVVELSNLPRVRSDVSGLSAFAFKVRNAVCCMKLVNRIEYMFSPELSDVVMSKLSPLMKSKFMDFASASYRPGISKLELISDFLTREIDINLAFGTSDSIQTICQNPLQMSNSMNKPNTTMKVHYAEENKSVDEDSCNDANSMDSIDNLAVNYVTRTRNKTCNFCNDSGHSVLEECKKFLSLEPSDRCHWAKKNQICMRCLKGNHVFKLCDGRCDECSKPHHKLLHNTFSSSSQASAPRDQVLQVSVKEETVIEGAKNESSTPPEEPILIAHNSDNLRISRPLLKVIPLTVFGPSGSVETFALLDDGATTSLIDQDLANLVGATGPKSTVNIKCIGGLAKTSEFSYVDVDVKGKLGDRYTISKLKSIPNLDISGQSISREVVSKYPYLSAVAQDLSYESIGKPMMIIGADNWHLTIPRAIRRGTRDQPVAVLTALGWVLYGKFGNFKASEYAIDDVHFIQEKSDTDIDQMLKDYVKLDSIGIIQKPCPSPNDARALELLQNSTSRLPSGRFQTGLLWKPNVNSVPDNLKMTLSRFYNLERKLNSDEKLKMEYKANIDAMISKGYAEECPLITKASSLSKVWYLPHFGVRHPVKKKLRVVHDAAAKYQGVSLNSMLLSGPDLLQPLTGVLMQFREGRIGLNADIREMFPQVKIIPSDRDAQRFVWRDNPSLPIKCYRMASMMFGATCSPCSAIYAKNLNAEEHRGEFPAAADAIIKNHYMDDLVISLDNDHEAAKLARDIIEVHSRACFEMRSWSSNSQTALNLVPDELRSSSSTSGVLGMSWNSVSDELLLSRVPKSSNVDNLTKRKMLSQLMSVYDPLGLLTPLVLKGRLLFQKVWKLNYEWDAKLSPDIVDKWSVWLKNLELISEESIPRCYSPSSAPCPVVRHLHMFADASQYAYATVAFWRFTFPDGSVTLSLVGGKSRLAPQKLVSIPRLELQAALIACRFAEFIASNHNFKPHSVTFWSDSLTVLKWLRNETATFKSFVAHRAGEIRETSDVRNWRYVPTMLNVADDATRSGSKFKISDRWFIGPSFLLNEPEDWPKEPVTAELLPEQFELVAAQTTLVPPIPPLPVVADHSHFSEWTRLVRATARAHVCARRFLALLSKNRNYRVSKHSDPPPSLAPALLASDIGIAEIHLFRQSQVETFLSQDWQWPAQLKRIKTYTDEQHLLRLSSRISNVSGLPTSLDPSPIVLYGHHPIVKLLVRAYHRKFAHANTETVVNELRQRFFIIPLRPSVKTVAASCLICRLRKSQPVVPPFGNLPDARVAYYCRPFSFVGLDYFGPTLVSCGRRLLKRYVALFTCLTIRAVHLEIVETLSSDSAIMALRRFIARRGCPTRIYSDNGTAFVGAARQLPEVFDFAANNKIEWTFIPPAAPFMGGAWERLVRSIKTALSTTLKERAPQEEVLSTLLSEAESIVNSRPLTHVAVDADSEIALTPFHFILNGSPGTPISQTMDDADFSRRCEWRKGLRLADHFWKRWAKEVLPLLAPRQDGAIPDLKLGDVVFIVDGGLPRGSWPKGRVTEVWTGPDGVARVAEVATKAGRLKRAIRLLVKIA